MRQPHRNARRSNQRRRRAGIASTLRRRASLRHFRPGLRSVFLKAFERKPGEKQIAEPINYDAASYGPGLSPAIYRAWLFRQRMMESIIRCNSLMTSSRDEQKSEIIPPGGGGNQQPASLTR